MAKLHTAGELRRILREEHAKWTVDPRLKDSDVLPQYKMGADLSKVPKINAGPRTDISPFLGRLTPNPFLLQRRIERGFINPESLPAHFPTSSNFLASAPARLTVAIAGGAGAAPAPAGAPIPGASVASIGATASAGHGLPISRTR